MKFIGHNKPDKQVTLTYRRKGHTIKHMEHTNECLIGEF